MSDEEKKKYIEEIFKYCKIDSILVINKTGQLESIDSPSEVLEIQDVGELESGLICHVAAAKMALNLLDVNIIGNKAYYYFNFRVMGRK